MNEVKKNEDLNDESVKRAEDVPNGVIVIVETDPDGGLNLKTQTLGSTEVISIPTVLKLAAKQVEEQLGI